MGLRLGDRDEEHCPHARKATTLGTLGWLPSFSEVMTTTTPNTTVRELARRRGSGLDVVLRWHPETDSVSIAVEDEKTGDRFEVEVAGDQALDAFEHPFAYRPAA